MKGLWSSALRMLPFGNPVRSQGYLTAHASAQKFTGGNVLGLIRENERNDMCAIFAAVYGVEPIVDVHTCIVNSRSLWMLALVMVNLKRKCMDCVTY